MLKTIAGRITLVKQTRLPDLCRPTCPVDLDNRARLARPCTMFVIKCVPLQSGRHSIQNTDIDTIWGILFTARVQNNVTNLCRDRTVTASVGDGTRKMRDFRKTAYVAERPSERSSIINASRTKLGMPTKRTTGSCLTCFRRVPLFPRKCYSTVK